MMLLFFGAGMALANKLHKLHPSIGLQVDREHKGDKQPIKLRPEGDAWTCFGGGRYEAMAKGEVCPGWEDQ
jgi:hypothetical protein